VRFSCAASLNQKQDAPASSLYTTLLLNAKGMAQKTQQMPSMPLRLNTGWLYDATHDAAHLQELPLTAVSLSTSATPISAAASHFTADQATGYGQIDI
jgi:hypothetical protein